MSCCTVNITSFASEAITTIPWSGVRPTIDVAYLQADGTFLQMGVFTQINFTTTDVIIDHGGTASGYVKLIQ
jgi:hypothetical protein